MIKSPESLTKSGIHQMWRSARATASEVGWDLFHLKRTLDQKQLIRPTEAENWLTLFCKSFHNKPNEFSLNGEIPVLGGRRAAGFWFTVYPFETSNGKFVIKIGHEHRPIFAQNDPSSKDYFTSYKENLAEQKTTYDRYLPYLILPQEVAFLHNGVRTTTLIAQPDIPHGEKFADFKALAPHEQERILGEYDIFISLSRGMRRRTDLTPDLLFEHLMNGAHNLVIGQTADGPHLVLLDNGSIDLTKNNPVLNSLAPTAAIFWPAFEKAFFQGIHKNGNQSQLEPETTIPVQKDNNTYHAKIIK